MWSRDPGKHEVDLKLDGIRINQGLVSIESNAKFKWDCATN